ncbi:cilia- and flagella-associated protein 74 [Aulostomus maculatus]
MEAEEQESASDLDQLLIWMNRTEDVSEETEISSLNSNGPGNETFPDEESALPPGLEWLEELSEEDDIVGDLAVAASDAKKKSITETARMFKLRRNLDQLDSFHRQKECDVLKARGELQLVRQNTERMLEQRKNLEKEIEQQKSAENNVAVFRLLAQHKNLCQELQNEEEVEAYINTQLRQQELELSEVELELGRFSLLQQQVHEEVQVFQDLKAQKAATRLQQERKARQNLQRKMQHLRHKQEAMIKEEEAVHQKKIEENRASHKIAAKHLRETIRRMHQQDAEMEQQRREFMEKRMQAVTSLKSNITATQESIRVQQSRAKVNAQKKEQQEIQLKESLQAQGINITRHMYQQKQLEEMRRKQEELEERQRSNRMEIVDRILQEEHLAERRNRRLARPPQPSTTDGRASQRRVSDKLQYYLDSSPPSAAEEGAIVELRKFSDSSGSSDIEVEEETVQQEVDHLSLADSLAEPEFCGLWDQNYKIPVNERTVQLVRDKPVMACAKIITPNKKVGGKEMTGASFMSKPEIILFKDFEVGETYKKKIILTNISYIINHCSFLGVSAQLKGFISINFEPPGSLSPGMSCDLLAIFQPMINEDLQGEVQFASVGGPFSVPVRCTMKKCQLEVDSQFLDFGSHVVGQTISRTITLTNKGALATLFSLDTSTCPTPETHHAQMPSQNSANTCQETTSDDQKSSATIIQDQSAELQQKQTDVDVHIDKTPSDSSDISLGNVREGEIGPFESIKLDLIFTPTVPGEAKLELDIKFSDLTSSPICIKVRGVAVSLPVWVVQPSIDLRICMFDHLYQDNIIIQSSANTALNLTFEVCLEMRKHIEILPKTGLIQAQSSFNAQLKFLPRCSLSKDAEKYFDSDTGVLEVPMTVQVAGQVQPVRFTVQAVVTSSDLKFDRTEVDFGYCSIHQSVRCSVCLTNLSLLPQDFGFLDIPEFIEIQPNDGFGTLLPQETIQLDLTFSASKAKKYNFQLTCKSGVNRDFPLSCRGVGVEPPLELSHSLVKFGATAVGDHATALLHVIYSHSGCSRKAAAPPRLFSFTPPPDADIRISPSTGCLLPGKKCLVQVTFRPRLAQQDIKDETLRLFREEKSERNRHTEQETKKEIPLETRKGKKVSVNQKNSKVSDASQADRVPESPKPADTVPGSQLYEKARGSLLRSFTHRYNDYTVPCFVSDGDPTEEDQGAQPVWSPLNTLHLRLQCPAVRPPLVVVPHKSKNIIDFQQVVIGERVVKALTVQNISKESLELRTSLLDLLGPFSLLRPLRSVRPGETYSLVLAFCPTLEKKYCETLEVQCKEMTLAMTLQGEGVVPIVTCSHPGGLLDFGFVLEKDSTSQVLKIQNSSAVGVGFRVLLQSLSPSRPRGGAEQLDILLSNYRDSGVQPVVGTQNYSGLCVFSAVPGGGSIAPGQSQDITVTFEPDHPSVHYSDKLTIQLMNKTNVCVMDLRGAASSHNMFLHGGDQLTVPIESLLPPLTPSQSQLAESEGMENSGIPVLVTLRASISREGIRPAVRELQVGCIPSTQSSKKNVEFQWDSIASLQQQGFTVEPSKGSVEAGHRRTITLTWTPQGGYKPYEVVQVCVPLTVKGDKTNVYRVTLMALVSTATDGGH